MVEVRKADSPPTISLSHSVKVLKCNYVYELTYIHSISYVLQNYKRVSKNKMLNLLTGEVVELDLSDNRGQNIASLRQTVKRLRNLINANFEGAPNELFVTLTYAENMTDVKRVYVDFKNFYKRLRRRFKDYEFLYIYAVEPQERGAWHIHLLLKVLNHDYLYIDNSVMESLWGHGFTKTKRLDDVDNVGAYLSSYLTDFIDGNGRKHKGLRLYMYPAGVNIYRASRNVRVPVAYVDTYGNVKKLLDDSFKTYEVSFNVFQDGSLINFIKKEFYNLKRSNSATCSEGD